MLLFICISANKVILIITRSEVAGVAAGGGCLQSLEFGEFEDGGSPAISSSSSSPGNEVVVKTLLSSTEDAAAAAVGITERLGLLSAIFFKMSSTRPFSWLFSAVGLSTQSDF